MCVRVQAILSISLLLLSKGTRFHMWIIWDYIFCSRGKDLVRCADTYNFRALSLGANQLRPERRVSAFILDM